MHILFIGGIFDDSHNKEIISKTKTYVEYAANNFQRKIIEGLRANGMELDVISAPFLGAYPMAYSDMIFKGFESGDTSGIQYVHFNNVWGLRNPSRRRAVKKQLLNFIKEEDSEKLIIVYTPHTPFIQAAAYAKRMDKRIRICLVIPDLPQFMNLADKVSPIYRTLKKYDVKKFLNESKTADTYVLLTEQMREPLCVGERPYIVVEGIYEPLSQINKVKKSEIVLAYTGKLDRSFGIMSLIHAFSSIRDDRLRLVICGSGEEKENVEKEAQKDERIVFLGQVPSNKAREIIQNADILINPRQNNTEYTKYSFPSKIIDYISTGNTVIAYKLDGMPDIYDEFVYYVPDNSVESLASTIKYVINEKDEQKKKKSEKGIEYISSRLSKEYIGKRIIELNKQRNS